MAEKITLALVTGVNDDPTFEDIAAELRAAADSAAERIAAGVCGASGTVGAADHWSVTVQPVA